MRRYVRAGLPDKVAVRTKDASRGVNKPLLRPASAMPTPRLIHLRVALRRAPSLRRQMHDIEHLVEWKARLFHCRQLAEKIGPDIELHGDKRVCDHAPLARRLRAPEYDHPSATPNSGTIDAAIAKSVAALSQAILASSSTIGRPSSAHKNRQRNANGAVTAQTNRDHPPGSRPRTYPARKQRIPEQRTPK